MKKQLPSEQQARIPPAEMDYSYFEDGDKHPFRGTVKKFDLCNAWWLAECSFLSYKEPSFIMQTLEHKGMGTCRFFETWKAFCFVVHMEKDTIVAFRGTRNSNVNVIQDIITNVRHLLIPAEPKGLVHRGFQEAFTGIWSEGGLGKYLEAYCSEHPEVRVWFTGHSLGGALATMAAVAFTTNHTLYTFGSPIVGNKEYARQVPKQSYRIVHSNDVVPYLPPPFPPPAGKNQKYTHAGSLQYIDRKGKVQSKVTDRNNLLAKMLTGASRVTNTLSDSKSSLLYRVYSLTKKDWHEQSPASKAGDELDKIASLLSDYMDASVHDHAPVLYSVHLWNNYIQGVDC